MSDEFSFEGSQFEEFKNYVMQCWRPNTEAYLYVTDKSIMYDWLNEWFNVLSVPIQEPDVPKIDIGPYIGIIPYGKFLATFKDKETKNDVYEFIFIYETIDKTKLTKEQLSLGRSDIVEIFHPKDRNDL